MKVVDTEEMKSIERKSLEEYGFSEQLIIENVGLRGADYLDKNVICNSPFGEIVFLVGKGNNGADGLSVARYLKNKGYSTRAFLLFSEDSLGENTKKQ
ncbi:MAG: NAD(P)H-hydrate epimerase, partial [Bdellovibrionota bacterium]|nr:NAD(P)H-hydrate epimerase [Bdellovibrionota bacterium]